MPFENRLPNIPIPLPIALYVIPLAIMAEYLAQQLWALVRQSLENEEDITLPPSSPSLPPSSLTTEEEISSVTTYATLSTSPSPVLPDRILDKGKQREAFPPTPPGEPASLPCLICHFENHSLESCPKFPKIPTVTVKNFSLLCILCDEAGHEVKGCPQYHCPICLRPAPGHSNNSCPNSPVDLSSDEEGSDYL